MPKTTRKRTGTRKAGAAGAKAGEAAVAPAARPEASARRREQEEGARTMAIEAARSLHDDKCEDVVVLDVRSIAPTPPLCDFIVIGSGTSDRQMRSAADGVKKVGASLGHSAVRHNVDERTTWYVADFVDVVVHVFEPNTRAYYDIEMMWGDAPRVEWARPAGEAGAGRVRGARVRSGASTAGDHGRA